MDHVEALRGSTPQILALVVLLSAATLLFLYFAVDLVLLGSRAGYVFLVASLGVGLAASNGWMNYLTNLGHATEVHACESILDDISQGRIRYITHDDEIVVSSNCGYRRFMAAANAPDALMARTSSRSD